MGATFPCIKGNNLPIPHSGQELSPVMKLMIQGDCRWHQEFCFWCFYSSSFKFKRLSYHLVKLPFHAVFQFSASEQCYH